MDDNAKEGRAKLKKAVTNFKNRKKLTAQNTGSNSKNSFSSRKISGSENYFADQEYTTTEAKDLSLTNDTFVKKLTATSYLPEDYHKKEQKG
mmetsp:Transcript_9136/g.10338  ORF Transcript_9136/g.10338 Transcript_9136/m.10338 type:complete len:92 (+) Transcript_9136:245-520(+)